MRAAGLPRSTGSLLADAERARRAGVLAKDRFGLTPSAAKSEPQALPVYAAAAPEISELQPLQPIPAHPQIGRDTPFCIIHETASFLSHPEALVHVRTSEAPPTDQWGQLLEGRAGHTRLGTPLDGCSEGLVLLPPLQQGNCQGLGHRSSGGGREDDRNVLLKTQLSSWQCVTSRHFKCPWCGSHLLALPFPGPWHHVAARLGVTNHVGISQLDSPKISPGPRGPTPQLGFWRQQKEHGWLPPALNCSFCVRRDTHTRKYDVEIE